VRGRIVRTASLLLLAAALAATASERRGGPPLVGQMAPAFTLPDLSGRPVSLDLQGEGGSDRGVGHRCAGYQREIPRLVEAYEKHHADGFGIMSPSADRTAR
jgi:hypothetical protein